MTASLSACTGGGAPDSGSHAARTTSPSALPTATGTPLSVYDSSGVTVARADLCPLITPSVVERALGGPVVQQSSYGDGDTTDLSPAGGAGPGLRDRVAEYGCTYAGSASTARAWVFAPAITRGRARTLVRDATGEAGCRLLPDAAALGAPSVATVCRGPVTGFSSRPGPDLTTVTYAGLLGDAWLSCSVTDAISVPVATIAGRAGDWCVAVATAGDTSP